MQIQIGRVAAGTFRQDDLDAMFALRFAVFRERLQWDVRCSDGREWDDYDLLDPTYLLVKDDDGAVCGCCRVLPTTGRYMMQDTFPETLQGGEAPRQESTWELSRFALDSREGAGQRFCDTAVLMMERLTEYALDHGVSRFVTVTTVAIERLLRSIGVPMERMGRPVQVGIECSVALSIPVDEALRARLREDRLACGLH